MKEETLTEFVNGKVIETKIESATKSNPSTKIFHIDQMGRKYKFRVFIYCYTVGKEEICIDLARAYQTKIVLDADRYRMIKRINYHEEFFTVNPDEGFIHLSKGINSSSKIEYEHAIHISLTGWINCKSYMCLKKGEYQVAYSSHSNFEELDEFVSIVRPSVIKPVVIERKEDSDLEVQAVKSLSGYLFWLQNMKQRGFELLSYLSRRKV
jgi:hypothetical protein